MRRRRVNLIDSVATAATRTARSRSAVVRIGTVNAAPSGGLVECLVGSGKCKAGYNADYRPAIGNQVALLNDGDKWLVLYQVADSTSTGGVYVNTFSLSVNGQSALAGGSYYRDFVQSQHRMGDPWIVRAGAPSYIDCVVSGIYQYSFYQRVNLPTARSTGYMQGVVEGQLALDVVVVQGGSTYTDLVFTSYPFGAVAGNNLRIRILNQTGGNGTLQVGWFSVTRLGPL